MIDDITDMYLLRITYTMG